jgi:hypothetical protein
MTWSKIEVWYFIDLVGRPRGQIVHVVDHGDEKVEEEFATILHFVLHSARALERVSSPYDESKIVCPQLRVVVRCIGVGVTRRQ